jgi:hypothetical protein
MTLLKASGIFLSLLWLQGCVEGQLDFAGEITCRTADGDALCPKLSHFESQVSVKPFSRVQAYLAYDPAQSRKATWYDSLDLNMQSLPPQKSWLADYGIDIELSPRWSLHAEDSSGTTLLPNASYLAFANKLQDIGWKQTVTRLSFTNSDIFVGDLLIGLGEGERLEADDGDLFLGARFKWYWQKALSLQLGYSEDQNSLPKDAVWWLSDRDEAHKSFRNQRFAASLFLNGQLSGFRGLEASLGWQRTAIDRSDDRRLSTPTHLALDPTEILSQDLGAAGSTKRDAWLASASYRILAEYLIAFHIGQFKADLAHSALSVCTMDQRGSCVEAADKTDSLSVREWTYGLGKIDSDGWSFLLESHQERYDRLYQNFHFLKGKDVRQKSMRLVQARINWNW